MKLLGNFLSLAGAELLSKLATILAFAHLARVAGPVGYGYVEFAGAVLLCAALLVDQGFGYYGAREIARDHSRRAALVGEIIFLRLALSLLASAAMAALAVTLDRGAVQRDLLLVYALCLPALAFQLQWIFQGYERMSSVAAIQLTRQGIFAAVVLFALHSASDLVIAGLAEVLGALAAGVLGIWMYRAQFGAWITVIPRVAGRTLREGATIGASQIFWAARMFGATVFFGLIIPAERGADLGYFGAAMRITIALHAFIWLYYFNLLPAMSRTWHEGGGAFARLVTQSMRVVAWLSMLTGVLWVILAPTVVRIIYKEPFAEAGPVLQWLSGVCVLAAIHGHFRMGLIAAGFTSAELVTAALGAIAALVLIPVLYRACGVTGAAIALVLGEAVVLFSTWALSGKLLQLHIVLRAMARPMAALAVLLFCLWLARDAGVVIQAGLTCVLGAALSLGLDAEMRALPLRVLDALRRQKSQILPT